MTRKYDDLVEFMSYIKSLGYRSQISRTHIDFFISKRFGISKYTKDSIVKALVDLVFLRNVGVGIFDICDGWKPDCVKIKEKEVEKK